MENKNRRVEVVITVIFIGSILSYFIFGFWYFAGFEYASIVNKVIISILTINIYLGLLYFTYRFLKWVIRGVIRLLARKT